MKLVKMSLAAAVLLGSSAFAIDNLKIDGDVKVYYNTNDLETTNPITGKTNDSLFSKETSAGDAALRVSATGNLMDNLSFGGTVYAISTLGLENSLVRSTWTGAHNASYTGGDYADVKNNIWLGEAWLAYTMGKTTAKVGRMSLDTPLAFSETWSVVPNTFEAGVLINQDLPDTTLVGAYVSKGNGVNAITGVNANGPLLALGLALDAGVVGDEAKFETFAQDGAYAVAVVNNSFKPLVAQAWYYNVIDVADAFWLQGDWDCQLVKNVKVGAQYAEMKPKGVLDGLNKSKGYAVKLAYSGVENLNLSAAYSSVDEDGVLKIANVATNNLGTAQSKLYTETYWTYGVVGAAGSDSWNLTAEYDVKDLAKFGAYYTYADNSVWDDTMNELAVTASKSFGPLDATLAYVNTDIDSMGSSINSIQAYLKFNF